MDIFTDFVGLPLAKSTVDFSAIALPSRKRDFLAKATDGSPVFLIHDSSTLSYVPAIELKNISARFHSTCLVTTPSGILEDQFAVVSCGTDAPELYELFIRCFGAAVDQLPATATTADIQSSVRRLLDLFCSLNRPSNRELAGLWAELFVISKCNDPVKAVHSWHSDPNERFDFSWRGSRLEVKSTVKEERQHEFALEQLRRPTDGYAFVASVLLQPLTGGMSVIDLATSIASALVNQPELRQKVWENVVSAMGVE